VPGRLCVCGIYLVSERRPRRRGRARLPDTITVRTFSGFDDLARRHLAERLDDGVVVGAEVLANHTTSLARQVTTDN
jgi:hypothetical protein